MPINKIRRQALETFRRSGRQLSRTYPNIMDEIGKIQYTILGQFPKDGMKTGYQWNKIQPKGVYINQYYHPRIMDTARKVRI